MSASVVIVDDNDLNCELLTDVLQGAGYGTAEAADGQQALDYLHDHAVMPDLILLDLMMPRMDGWEFLRRRHREASLACVPVILFTASDGVNPHTVRALGVADVLHKPAQPREILAAIGHHC